MPNEENNYLQPTKTRKWLNYVIDKYKLPPHTTYGLRHTHTSLLIEAGANMKQVQARLGHSYIKTTMDIYTHLSKHEYTYEFLVEPIQVILSILKNSYDININSYSNDDLYKLITKFLSGVSRSNYSTNSIEITAPGLLRHIPNHQKQYSYGLKHPLDITCPNLYCNHSYTRMAKRLVKSKDLCPRISIFCK